MEQTINAFPGYEFKHLESDNKMHNIYRGTDMGFGGYIISNPGMYGNVALLDVQSMHPNSAVNLNYFGKYTKNFEELLRARVLIKHGEYDEAKKLFGGKLAKYLNDPDQANALAQALKIAINSVYGLTSASFETPFRDTRNKNNIVALRGALFMRTLQDEVESRGFSIVAIKTDSIKIADATPEIIQFCMEFAKKYGYIFEHEATYDRICQINDADYIAKYKDGKHAGEWTATGAQFQVPYVFKTLFSKEEIVFEDMCETKSVKDALYLDMNEDLPDVSEEEKMVENIIKNAKKNGINIDISKPTGDGELDPLLEKIAQGHNYHFIGKVGQFCPIKSGCGGGILYRGKDGKYYAATGTKGYRWLESEMVKSLDKENDIDRSYYDRLVDEAIANISQYGDFEWFVSDDPYIQASGANDGDTDVPPWMMPCGEAKYKTCFDCPHFEEKCCALGYNISNIIFSQSMNPPEDEDEEYLPFN